MLDGRGGAQIEMDAPRLRPNLTLAPYVDVPKEHLRGDLAGGPHANGNGHQSARHGFNRRSYRRVAGLQ